MADERRHGNRPGPGGPGGSGPGRGPQRNQPGGGDRNGGPSRQNGPRGQAPPRSQAPQRSQPPTEPKPAIVELPMADAPEPAGDEKLLYFAYGENGDDIAFEICDDIEEAFGVYQIMKEDGFTPRLFQASEIQIVEDPEA